ncbi:SH3 domain-containing protein [Palleronia sp. LCG004]|uniref:SH3 domain-containing protein n=1 Tax=Palleronia sp. LCG004 TaxID=3079304 RepID=UPI00294201E0|nr:SH3 domain-containing protein [Palleronia sp. LCG004]WOI56668.1 SH3 domain-containing protein [Palleronia sp. LCG004]
MIRMTLALLAMIGVTMAVAGRDLDGDGTGRDYVARASATPTDVAPANPNRLALDDEAGAIARALAATGQAAGGIIAEPAQAVTETPQTADPAPMVQYHVITGNRVNIRRGPSTADEVVDQVVLDQRVEVLDETANGWMHIRVEDTGQEAYIFGRFVGPAAG